MSDDQIVTDYDIQALIDNELNYKEEKRVRVYIEHNLYAKKRYKEIAEQKRLLNLWWKNGKN